MKPANAIFALVVFVLGFIVSTSALAQHRHHQRHGGGVSLGVFVGPGFFYSPPPYYYQPRVVVVPAPSPVYYIERVGEQPAASLPQGYWYYCGESKTYYPYIKECPGGWQPVAPQPPG